MMEVCDWNCTKEALKGLGRSLGCGVCNNPLLEPCTLGSCDHLFCRACTKAHLGNACPICRAPAWVKDLQLKRELASVVGLYNQLCSVVDIDTTKNSKDVEKVTDPSGQIHAKGQKVIDKLHDDDIETVAMDEEMLPRKPLHPRNVSQKVAVPSMISRRKLTKASGMNSFKALSHIGKRKLCKQDSKCLVVQENDKNKPSSSSSENEIIDPMSVFDFIPSPHRPKPTKKRVRKPNPRTVKRQRIAAANRRWLKGQKVNPKEVGESSDTDISLRHVSFSVGRDRSQTSCLDLSSLESTEITSQEEDPVETISKQSNDVTTVEEPPCSTQESGYNTGSFRDVLTPVIRDHLPTRSNKVKPSSSNLSSSQPISDGDFASTLNHLDDNSVHVHVHHPSKTRMKVSKHSKSSPLEVICPEGLLSRGGKRDKTTKKEQQATVSRQTRSRILQVSDQTTAGKETNSLNETTLTTEQCITNMRPERRLTRNKQNPESTHFINDNDKPRSAFESLPDDRNGQSVRQTRNRSASVNLSNTPEQDSPTPPRKRRGPLQETVKSISSVESVDLPLSKSRTGRNRDSRRKPTASSIPETSRKDTKCLEEAPDVVNTENGTPSTSEKPTISRVSTSPRSGSTIKRNKRGETPLHIAVIKGDIVTARQLLQEGADPNVMDNARWTPLHEACNHGHASIVTVLLDHGALINTPGFEHDSPLHDAVMNHRLDVVKLLLQRGASLDVRNMHGLSPADYAKSEPMRAVLKTKPLVAMVTKTIATMSKMSVQARHRPVVLLGTGLGDSERKRLQACAKLLGNGRVVMRFGPEVTHLVASCNHENLCMRTMKYLNAVLSGVWVVSFKWITECLRTQQQASEIEYEVNGTTTRPNCKGEQKGRQNAEHQLPGLLDGCHFFLQSTFSPPTPSKQEIVQLIKNGGGTVLSRQPKPDDDVIQASSTVPYHARAGSDLATCSYYIIHDHVDSRAPPRVRTGKLCTAPISWLMDCISQFELVNLPN